MKTVLSSLLSVVVLARAFGQTEEASPKPSAYPPPPAYPVPYRAPAVDEIKSALDRVHQRLEKAVVFRIIDSQTREEITDFAKPNPNAVVDPGLEGKFRTLDYTMGVINHGMLLATEVTGDPRYASFTAKCFQFYTDDLPKLTAWGVQGSLRGKNPFRYLINPDSLDAIGATGSAMIKARMAKLGPDLKEVIDRGAEHISKGQYRMADGTLARNRPRQNSVWADDLYMGVPFLARMGAMTGEQRYFDDAVKQVLQISSRLFVPAKGIYMHAWNAEGGDMHPKFHWGRANGWCLMAMVELLEVLPENHPGRPEVLKLLQASAYGLANLQSGSGLWHQLLDREDTFLETSCSGMITFALARAVNRGWLDPFNYGPIAIAGWNGLNAKITPEGHIEGTCIGTNYGNDFVFYYHRPAADDVHGYGPMLLAGSEMIRMLKNDKLTIRSSASNTAVSVEKKR